MATRRTALLPPYLASNPAWVQLVAAIDEVFETEVDLPTQLLSQIRDNWILGATAEDKIGTEVMLDNTDFFKFDRETLIRQANFLGFLLKETDLLTDDEYQRLVRNLGAFWFNKGTPEFKQFMQFILGCIIDVRKLFALPGPTYDTYGFMREEGDPLIGKLNWQYEETLTSLLSGSSDTVANGGPWTMGPNVQRAGVVLGPTGNPDAVVYKSLSSSTGVYLSAPVTLENLTKYRLVVWLRRLSTKDNTAGSIAASTDLNNDNTVETTSISVADVPLVWTQYTLEFTTGTYGAYVASQLFALQNWDFNVVLAVQGAQLYKVTNTNVSGQWFETSHVNLIVDPLSYQVGTLKKVVALFNVLANFNLVLNTVMFEMVALIHSPGDQQALITKAYPMIDIETTIYSKEISAPTVLSVSSPTWTRGGELIFNVILSGSSSVPFNLSYATAGTAVLNTDYTTPYEDQNVALVGATVQVPPGVSAFAIHVPLIGSGSSKTLNVTVGGVTGNGTIS